jgi:hypothetical protein
LQQEFVNAKPLDDLTITKIQDFVSFAVSNGTQQEMVGPGSQNLPEHERRVPPGKFQSAPAINTQEGDAPGQKPLTLQDLGFLPSDDDEEMIYYKGIDLDDMDADTEEDEDLLDD